VSDFEIINNRLVLSFPMTLETYRELTDFMSENKSKDREVTLKTLLNEWEYYKAMTEDLEW
jgi:hypothetical protein